MNFLNLGPLELIVVLIVAFVVVGPERVAEVGNSLGRLARQLRHATTDLAREAITREVERDGSLSPPPPSTSLAETGEEAKPNLPEQRGTG